MVAQIQGRVGFTGFGKSLNTPNIPLPLQTNAMIVVVLGGMNTLSPDNPVFKSSVSLGTNQPAQSVQDNMGNAYYRINTLDNNSQLINPLLYEEIWVATINSAILKNLVVTVTYPSTTLIVGEVIIVTPQNPQNQLNIDNAVLTNDNVADVFGSIGLTTTQITGELITPTLPNELLLMGLVYVFNNQPPSSPPTTPNILALGGSILLDNNNIIQNIPVTLGSPIQNTYGLGLSIVSQVISGSTNINISISSQGQSVCSWCALVLAIQEVTTAQLGIQESIISAPVSPESVALVSTLTPGVNVIKLPLGT